MYYIRRGIMLKDYSKTKIHKIYSYLGDKIYIGSTLHELVSQRMETHVGSYKQWKKNNAGFTRSFILFEEYGVENCIIELIEAKPCIDIHEQAKLESSYIQVLKCVNKNIPGGSIKESQEDKKKKAKEYRIKNKDNIKEYRDKNKEKAKEYRDNNKEKIKENEKQYKEKNKEIIKEKNKAYYENNIERIKEYRENNKKKAKEYRDNNKALKLKQ
jgi:hypothetical protein